MGRVADTRKRRRARRTLRLGSETPVLTVIVPVYNESRTIDELLRRVLAAPYAKQVIVVDDGSTDGTAEVLDSWRRQPRVMILRHSSNQGKGASIRTGLEHAQGLGRRTPWNVYQTGE